MSIGPDIKEVHQEVGAAFTITIGQGAGSGEYLTFDPNAQVTKPFVREFFLEAELNYDTGVQAGDVITVSETGIAYMIMNMTAEVFEDEITLYSAVLHKCNITEGVILRSSGEVRDPDTRRKEYAWQTIQDPVYALLTEIAIGTDLEEDEPIGRLDKQYQELFIPSSYGIQRGDRFEASSGEYYRVETVMKRRYDQVDLCEVGEDNR